LRVLLAASPEGGCHVSYWSTTALAARHDLSDDMAARLDGVAALVDHVTTATQHVAGM
jgi:hypothetical protein